MTHPTIILWDWNGTLADDGYASLLAVNDMLEKRSMPAITMEQYYQYIDTPISKFYEHLFDLNQVTMDTIAVEFAEGYARHFQGLQRSFICSSRSGSLQMKSNSARAASSLPIA